MPTPHGSAFTSTAALSSSDLLIDNPLEVDFGISIDLRYPSETLPLDIDVPLTVCPSQYVLPNDSPIGEIAEMPESETWFDFRKCINIPFCLTAANFTSCYLTTVVSVAEPAESSQPAAIAKRWFSRLYFERTDEDSLAVGTGFMTGGATEQNELLETNEAYQPNPSRWLGSQWLQEPLPSIEFLVSLLGKLCWFPSRIRVRLSNFYRSLALKDSF